MKAVFIELPAFAKHRQMYLSDNEFRVLQQLLLVKPEAGVVIQETGGLRKLRFADNQRGKGKRGGLRIIYHRWEKGKQVWLFTVYSKGEMEDLTSRERTLLKLLLTQEMEKRQ
ncbi:MAG: toxin [bacterium]|nr:toxin [bacterium]